MGRLEGFIAGALLDRQQVRTRNIGLRQKNLVQVENKCWSVAP